MSNFTPEQIQEILDLYYENSAHRQYIGARYVPIFGRKGETSIEWDNSAPYEPLTIVLHEGNSYTSRQFVPTGVAITNELYWANTGNYNAQVEQYRQDVEQLSSSVGTLSDMLPSTDFDSVNTVKAYVDQTLNTAKAYVNERVSDAYVGNYGAVEKSNDVDWQSVIDAIAEVSNVIDFGSGVWYINEELTIPTGIYCVFGNGAVIEVNEDIGTLFSYQNNDFDKRFFLTSGIKFMGNEHVDVILDYTSIAGNSSTVSDCIFSNFNEKAINSAYLGSFIQNCQFSNYGNVKNKGYGIYAQTDSHIDHCKFFHMGTAIHVGATSTITGCYFFNQQYSEYVYAIEGPGEGESLHILNNEFDCVPIILNLQPGFVNKYGIFMNNNTFYWNATDDTLNMPHYIFYSETGKNLNYCEFSGNALDMANDPILAVVYSFAPNIYVPNSYVSENNSTNALLDQNDTIDARLAHFAIACGFTDRVNNAFSAGKFIKFEKVTRDSEVTDVSTAIHIAEGDVFFQRKIGNDVYAFNARGTAKAMKAYFVADTSTAGANRAKPFYITGFVSMINKVVFSGCCYNMLWLSGDTEPDAGEYTNHSVTLLS